jgi:hypothetical protein
MTDPLLKMPKGRDPTYKPVGHKIVTAPLTPELHRLLRIRAVTEGVTIKQLITRLIETECASK